LVTVDSIEANNNGSANVTVTVTCGDPFGNTTRLTCLSPSVYIGKDNTTLTSPGVFQSTCCVSLALVSTPGGIVAVVGAAACRADFTQRAVFSPERRGLSCAVGAKASNQDGVNM
jgi:hypothetical protein